MRLKKLYLTQQAEARRNKTAMDAYKLGWNLAKNRGDRHQPSSTNIHYQKAFLETRLDNKKDCGPTAIECGETCISNKKECLFDKYGATLNRVEEGIAYKQKEELSFINPRTGKEIQRIKGEESYVIIPDGLEGKLDGAIATHNHPALGFAHGEPRSTGVSFSAADISVACHYNLGEMRAVSPGYRFSMTPPDTGWNDEFFEKEVAPSYQRNFSKNYVKNYAMVSLGFRDSREAQVLVHHETWQDVAKETGMRYSLKRVKTEKMAPRNFNEQSQKAVSDIVAGTERAVGLAISAGLIYSAKSLAQQEQVIPSDEEMKNRVNNTRRLIQKKIRSRK